MLLDTSGLLCFFDNSDSRHTDALTFFQSSAMLLTHDCVLAEFVPLSYVRGFKRENTLRFVRSLIKNPLVEIVWTTDYHYAQALALLEARLDKTYSLCDAISFVLMRERQISEALTTDHHFEQEGFVRLLPQ